MDTGFYTRVVFWTSVSGPKEKRQLRMKPKLGSNESFDEHVGLKRPSNPQNSDMSNVMDIRAPLKIGRRLLYLSYIVGLAKVLTLPF